MNYHRWFNVALSCVSLSDEELVCSKRHTPRDAIKNIILKKKLEFCIVQIIRVFPFLSFPFLRSFMCSIKPWPLGGAVSHAAAVFLRLAESFYPSSYPECKVRDSETSAAWSLLGYHGDKRHVFPLSLRGNKRFAFPLHENTRWAPSSAETCRTFSPDWRKDIASDRHGSVGGAVHKGNASV